MRNRSLFLSALVLLAMTSLLAACGGAVSVAPPPLTQSFTSSDDFITLQYPAEWVASDLLGQVTVANSQAAIDALTPAPGQFQARLFVTPISAVTGLSADATPRQIIEFFAESLSTSGVTFNAASDITIGGRAAARVDGSGTDGQAVVLVIDQGGGDFAFVSATAAPGELIRYEPTLQAILATLTYTAPVATAEATP